jgi:hypothetical protein
MWGRRPALYKHNYNVSLCNMTPTLERGEMSAVLHIKVALGPIGPTPSSLFTQMSSSSMAILSNWKGATLIRVKNMEFRNETATNCLNYVNTLTAGGPISPSLL